MGLPPTDVGNVRGRPTGGGDLFRLPPEHGHTINYGQAHYRSFSGGESTPRDEGVEAVVGAGVS